MIVLGKITITVIVELSFEKNTRAYANDTRFYAQGGCVMQFNGITLTTA